MGVGKFKSGNIERTINRLQVEETQLHQGSLVSFEKSNEFELYEAERKIDRCDYCGQELWRFRPVDMTEIYRRPPQLIFLN